MGGVTSTRTLNLREVLETEIEHKADPPDSSMRIAPPPGHPPPTHRTMATPLNERTPPSLTPCDMDMGLLNAVYEYFLHLVGRMPHASISDNFCARETDNFVHLERRILMAFSRCSNIPVFTFDMTVHNDIDHWLRLYHTAMRCSIHPCQSGFIFIFWKYWDSSRTRRKAHSTSMYFDLQQNKQIFVDPPSVYSASKHHKHWIRR